MNKSSDKQYQDQAIDSLITVDPKQWVPGPSQLSVSKSLDCQLSPAAPKNYRSLVDLVTDLVVTKTVTPAPEWSANHVNLPPCVFKPAGERFTTIDDLNDDCLIALLSKVSFMDQILTVPLTCQRWNVLLPHVHRERTKLVIWEPSLRARSFANDKYHFLSEPTVTTARYSEYLNFLLNGENCRQLNTPNREFFTRRFLDSPITNSISKTIIDSFPHLIHLSLVGVRVLPGTLLRLLGHFQLKLQSLYLDLFIHREANESYEQICDAIRPIWALIDSMASLRQLGLKLDCIIGDPDHLNLASALSTILPGLEEFKVTNYENDIFPVLLRLEETKLRRLSLRGTRWPGRFLFYHLLRAKPGLSALTHLTIGDMHIEVKGKESHLDWGTFLLRQIVHFLPQLQYLNLAFQVSDAAHRLNTCSLTIFFLPLAGKGSHAPE